MKHPKPQIIVFDFDGVLTDNKVYVGEDGKETVCCNRSDGLAFDVFRRLGLKVFLMSTETNTVVRARAEKLQVPAIQAVTDKHKTVVELARRENVSLAHILFIGNDLNDLEAMRACGFSACPADSHPRVSEGATFVLRTNGGQGVAREIAEDILGIDIAEVFRN